jgi:hypothetical protein
LVSLRSTLIKVNFLGSFATASPGLSISMSESPASQLRCRLHPRVLYTVISSASVLVVLCRVSAAQATWS